MSTVEHFEVISLVPGQHGQMTLRYTADGKTWDQPGLSICWNGEKWVGSRGEKREGSAIFVLQFESVTSVHPRKEVIE